MVFVFGDDLDEVLVGQVVVGFEIDDLDFVFFVDEFCDGFEGDVVVGFGVVEVLVGVLFDQEWFFFCFGYDVCFFVFVSVVEFRIVFCKRKVIWCSVV